DAGRAIVEGADLEPRILLLQVRDLRLDSVSNLDDIGIAVFADRDRDGRLAVEAHNAGDLTRRRAQGVDVALPLADRSNLAQGDYARGCRSSARPAGQTGAGATAGRAACVAALAVSRRAGLAAGEAALDRGRRAGARRRRG